MRHRLVIVVLALAACNSALAAQRCERGLTVTAWQQLDAVSRSNMVPTLVACLEHTDPAVRDGYAYSLITELLRGNHTDRAVRSRLLLDLLEKVRTADGDSLGFRGPFAVLVLAEVMRADRLALELSSSERIAMIDGAVKYFVALRDYRGYSESEGWRHGIAHSADFFMQSALHPALTSGEANVILQALAQQIAPVGEHSYIFGEPARLARPVVFLAQRELLTAEEWMAWFTSLGAQGPRAIIAGTGESLARMAYSHNTTAFASAVHVAVSKSDDARLRVIGELALGLLP